MLTHYFGVVRDLPKCDPQCEGICLGWLRVVKWVAASTHSVDVGKSYAAVNICEYVFGLSLNLPSFSPRLYFNWIILHAVVATAELRCDCRHASGKSELGEISTGSVGWNRLARTPYGLDYGTGVSISGRKPQNA